MTEKTTAAAQRRQYTLNIVILVLALVVAIKETLFRFVSKVGHQLSSTAVQGHAWHHRADAITSAAAFIGISIALIGDKSYELADDWAALFASAVILFNGYRIFRVAPHRTGWSCRGGHPVLG